MKIGKKDWIFIAIVAAVIIIFYAISGEEKTSKVPNNATHAPFYEVMKKTGSKKEAEKGCLSCHKEFPANHPSPNRCLFCHKLVRS
ncbi:MAG TPA: cytochrome C [Verrucomicrobiae bacterium]|nr:cytochrome C [Verrucomicrobiae bacterium]